MPLASPRLAGSGAVDAGGTARTAVLCGVLAAGAAAVTHVVGPPPVDAPAHAFQTLAFARHGFALWDNYWYAGYYQYVLYSVLYYPVAFVGGIFPVAVVSVALSAWAFASATGCRWGLLARWPSLAFAVTVPVVVMVSGMFPFIAGVAVAGLVVVLLQRRRRIAGALAIMVVPAFSPLAFLLLLVVLAASLAASPEPRVALRRNSWAVGAVAAALAVATALKLVFAQSGYYPFSLVDLGTALGISGVGLVITRARVRRDFLSALFVVYALVNVALFVVPSPVGSNATRLYSIAALPLLWLAARVRTPPLAWRRLIGVLVVVFAIQVEPVVVSAYHSYQESAAAAAAFWRPALSFLRVHRDAGHRVEVVATADHWEAYYLAQAGVSLARGWYRQADFPENQLLYQSTVSPPAYRAWLRALGVKYVLLPDVPLDYSSQAEASLIRSGRSGLSLVGTASHWRFYRLPDSVGIVSGSQSTPRRVHVTAGAVSFLAPEAGSYRIRIRYSPYWRPGGQLACVSQTPDGMMRLVASAPGTVSLTMPDPLDAFVGNTTTAAPCAG